MYINKEQINKDEMKLYDYVLTTFDRICDLTEQRYMALEQLLNNFNAKYINFGEFRAVFDLEDSGIFGVMALLTDPMKEAELNKYGLLCYEASKKEEAIQIDGPALKKVSQ